MATLMRYKHPKLGIIECDAKCYNADKPDCACICKGKNHGVGFQVARAYTTEHAHEMIKEYERSLKEQLELLL